MAFTKGKRVEIHKKYNGRCAYCGKQIEINKMQIDHIIPKLNFVRHVSNKFRIPAFLRHLTVDDMNHIDNLNPACGVCNKWKSANDLELFRSEIEAQVKRLNEYSANFRMAKRYGLIEETGIDVIFYFETK